jgi:hypothetical protein
MKIRNSPTQTQSYYPLMRQSLREHKTIMELPNGIFIKFVDSLQFRLK